MSFEIRLLYINLFKDGKTIKKYLYCRGKSMKDLIESISNDTVDYDAMCRSARDFLFNKNK